VLVGGGDVPTSRTLGDVRADLKEFASGVGHQLKASITGRGTDVGRRTSAARRRRASTPANSRSGVGTIQLMRARH
jgi:hypothetical protein